MKVKQANLSQERKLLVNLITSTEFCKRVLPLVKPYYLKTSDSKTIFNWIQEYFNQYDQAPNRVIQDIYYNKKIENPNDETLQDVGEFLQSISNEYTEENSTGINIEYEVEQSKKYLRLQSLNFLKEELSLATENSDPDAGEEAVSEYSKIEEALSDDISVLKDTKEIIDAFNEDEEVLFRFPDALGSIAGDFHRGDFMSFFAPAKRGKTQYLWYTAEYAMSKGLKVIFFTLEMTKRQMIRRAWRSMCALPDERSVVKIPVFKKNDSGKFSIEYREEERRALDPSKAELYQNRLRKLYRKGDVRIVQLPGYQATVKDIENYMDKLSFYDHYNADVVVIDYADLMAPTKNLNEYRHRIDDIWKGIRALAQRRNILAVTASQTNKETFNRDIRQGDAAEDIRKIAHVTCALALNQKEEEHDKGIIRVKQLAIREGKQINDQALVLECLDIGKAYLDSKLLKDCTV